MFLEQITGDPGNYMTRRQLKVSVSRQRERPNQILMGSQVCMYFSLEIFAVLIDLKSNLQTYAGRTNKCYQQSLLGGTDSFPCVCMRLKQKKLVTVLRNLGKKQTD